MRISCHRRAHNFPQGQWYTSPVQWNSPRRFPAPHAVHTADPAELTSPALHVMQLSIDVCPVSLFAVPTGQFSHTEEVVAMIAELKVPAGQGVQAAIPGRSAYVPAIHSVQL